MLIERSDVTFPSGNAHCVAWLYRPSGPAPGAGIPAGTDGASAAGTCVVMAHGFSLTRHDGLAAYGERFAAAGASVLVFDHRHLGGSPGEPRQRFRKREQREDWRAAVTFARGVAGVVPGRIVLWGFSFGGGHAVETAADDPLVAATIALCPLVDGLARVLATPPLTAAWILPRALADQLGRHNLVPVTGRPGARAAMTLPGEADGFAAAVPGDSPWRNEISPGVFLTVGLHRPLARARKLRAPLWVGLGERDVSVSRRAVERLAERAPQGELHRYPYDHFGAFLADGPERVAADQLEFLRRHGLLAERVSSA